MTRLRWYGPTILLLVAALIVMVRGQAEARRLAGEYRAARLQLIANDLKESKSLAELSSAFKDVAKVVEPSVVHVQIYRKASSRGPGRGMSEQDLFRRFFGPRLMPPEMTPPDEDTPADPPDRDAGKQPDTDQYDIPQLEASGSAWLYDSQGHVITNRHVVHGADKIVLRFSDGAERTATIRGEDERTDIAVLKVAGDHLTPARLAEKPVEQGEIVFAFGSPFRFEFSMSQGIVSAKGRRLGIVDVKTRDGVRVAEGYESFIQTDAAINPGNSGGPLTNIYGEVVGMNTAIATRTGTYNGLGFAIPVQMVKSVADQLIAKGKVSRGYLGIYIRDLDEKMAATFGYKGKGVLVENPIAGGPGEAAGLKRGDIISKVGGKPVATADELRNLVAAIEPGTSVGLEYTRDGKTQEVQVKVGQLPDQVAEAAGPEPDAADGARAALTKLGLSSVTDLTQAAARRYRVKFMPGVLVLDVRANSAAQTEGLRPGVVITDVMGVKVDTVDELVAELNKHDLKKGVSISVTDGAQERFVLLALPE